MKIKAFGEVKELENGLKLYEIAKKFKPNDYKKYLVAKINNELTELSKEINEDCDIEYLSLDSRDGMYVYQSTLRFLISYAIKKLYPKSEVIFYYSISRSLFCRPINIGDPIDFKFMRKVQEVINDAVSKDLIINKSCIDVSEAKKIYTAQNYYSKVDLLDYRDDKTVNIYNMDGYNDYMYNYLTPSSSYIKNYKITLYSPGLIIQYPRAEIDGEIPEYKNEFVLGKTLIEEYSWDKITGIFTLADFNKLVDKGEHKELINLCETRHNNMLAELGNNIKQNIDNIKIICVAGPSSSGKTTFTNRLRIELLTKGIKPLMISLDDYYKNSGYPLNEDGTPDFEHIEALDLDLFNEQILALISGEEVKLPTFDFKTRTTSFSDPIKLEENQPIMIEGIHALNDRLTSSIPANNKYKIYIAPHAHLHMDNQNPISMTEIRLIRRLVRDYNYRNSDPCQTINMWPSVRRGEFRWIYPYQEQADFVFNSELSYELAVLKKPALKILSSISKDKEEYVYAKKLINILKYFNEIDDKWIPCNSIIREFIGGSIFYED